jgi:hypothetical protein
MPYAMAIYESGTWKPVLSLADADAAACIDAIKRLHKFESDHSAFVIAHMNALAYEQGIENHVKRITQRHAYHPFELHVIALDANRNICNFLFSFTAFLDQSERLIRDQFGSTSQHLRVFQDERRKIHNSSHAYRLMYALRNFAQHRTMPVTGIKGDVGSAATPAQVVVGFHRDDLLGSGHDWKRYDRIELRALPKFVELTPYVRELREKIRYLYAVQLALCNKPYLAAAQLLDGYISKVGVAADRALVVATDAHGAPVRVESDWLPATTVRRLISATRQQPPAQ